MDAFEACVSCAQYIKRTERACPFCRSVHAPSAPRPRRASPRVSRGAWLATTLASSLALGGCSGATLPDPSSENPTEAHEDAAADAGAAGEAGAESAVAEGSAGDVGPVLGLDAGALDVDDAGHDSGWHGCYGSPPARPERGARRAIAA